MDDDEIPGALPVIDEDGTEVGGSRGPRHSRLVVPKGNTKAVLAADRRREVMAEAKGAASPRQQQWRESLRDGKRNKAASELTQGGVTHNSGSGFGLA